MSAWTAASLVLAALAASLWALERWRLQRLLRWAARGFHDPAPGVMGACGELAYRFEKTLRQSDTLGRRERERLQQFLSALEAYPNGLLLLDADDHIQWMNQVAADYFELDAHRDLQQNLRNLVRKPAFIALLQEQTGCVTLNGGAQKLQVTLRRFGDERQGYMSLLVAQDVTERLQIDRMRRDFVANVSHEIRSPLTVISGFLETLEHMSLAPDERLNALRLMRQQADRMQLLVTDLLALARLEGAPKPAPDDWMNLQALVQRCFSDAQTLDAGSHRLSMDLLEPSLEISGQESEWLSAFGNLVSNALRYTPAGGAVHIAWKQLHDGRGEFSVLDTGPGIATEHLSRLTERFYRVDGSRSRNTGGTGLGLSIVKHVAQRHGAELVIESELGKGSQFRIRLPSHRVRKAA
jgi:two-component system, OmpR family, phosphate regulon sensor histidine kinase PhoR